VAYKRPKLSEDSAEYFKLAVQLALSEIIIKQCRDCGRPVHYRYCCTFCGSSNPTSSNQEESVFYIEEFLK